MSARQQVHRTFRGNSYYFRIAIPIKLQTVLGGRELKRSLKTANTRQATYFCRALSNGMERFFMIVAEAQPRQADYQKMMREYFERILCQARESHSMTESMLVGSEPLEPANDPYNFAQAAERELIELRAHAQTYGYTENQERQAADILKESGFETMPHSGTLASYLMNAALEAKRIEIAYYQRDIQNVPIKYQPLRDCRNYFEDHYDDSVSLKTCCDLYIAHKQATVKPKSLLTIKSVMRRLQDILSAERDIRILKKQPDGVFLEQMAKKIPANLLRDHAGKSVKEVAESGVDYETINPKTLSTYWGYFQEFFNWAVDRGYLASNPIDRIKPSKVKTNQKARNRFSDEQLNTFFRSPIYIGRKNEKRALWEKGNKIIKDGNYWLPLVAAFTGMREAEILQLTPDTLKEQDGIHYFDLNEENGVKDIKTYNGIRIVPIHPELIKMGFLKYCQKRRSIIKAYGRIFEDGVTIPDTQDITKNYSRSFSEYTVKVGLRQSKDGMEVFHSFRHNVQTALSEADVKNVIACWILGYKPPKETQTIGDMVYTHTRPDLKKLYKAICKVKYAIDLSHLYEQ